MTFTIRAIVLIGPNWSTFGGPKLGGALPGETIAAALRRCARGEHWRQFAPTQAIHLTAHDEAGFELGSATTTASELYSPIVCPASRLVT